MSTNPYAQPTNAPPGGWMGEFRDGSPEQPLGGVVRVEWEQSAEAQAAESRAKFDELKKKIEAEKRAASSSSSSSAAASSTAVPGIFEPSATFSGPRPGFTFKDDGPHGKGYYCDEEALEAVGAQASFAQEVNTVLVGHR